MKACSTVTPVVIYLILTRAIVLTGSRGTLVDVQITVEALKSRHTETLVCIDPVFTDGSILARLGLALVYVLLTGCPLVPCSTLAQGPRVRDVHAGAPILACFLRTFGHIILALFTSKSNWTVAGIAIDCINTVGPITVAGVTLTFIDTLGAVEPCEAIWAVAAVLASSRFACAVGASCVEAGVIQLITVFTCKPQRSFGAKANIVTKVVETSATIVAGRR